MYKEKNFTANCLAKGHRVKECKSEVRCKINSCNKKYDMLLHTTNTNQKPSLNTDNNQHPPAEAQAYNFSKISHSNRTFLQIVPITTTNGKNSIKIPCSDATLIRRDIANQLQLKGVENACLQSTKFNLILVDFSISSAAHPESNNIKSTWVVSRLDIKRCNFDLAKVKTEYQQLRHIDLLSPNPNDITLLIDTDFPNLLVDFDFRCGGNHEPYGVGWILMGGRTLKRKNVNVNRTEILPYIERF